ncbi:MAG: DUF362 domain-containing protein [Lentisphaerae bacterium]|nr:DUF362 domain-containing protein [Lentisphaerota bacterium]
MPAKVIVTKCSDYGPGVQPAVDCLLAGLGGISAFVKRGQSVLIKPNLLSNRSPDLAVTTHPDVLRAVIRRVKEAGGVPAIADSPHSVFKIERVWEDTGIAAVSREEGAPLINLEKAGSTPVSAHGLEFGVAKPVLDADVVINLPKVKTHMLTVLTCAVKNMYGSIPGNQKTMLHRKYPDVAAFARLLSEICIRVKPCLSLCDGVVGMEGPGPSAGRPVRLGFLAASADPFALDRGMCRLLRIPERAVPYLRHDPAPHAAGGARLELCFAGTTLDDLRLPRFARPSSILGRLIPGGLVRMLGRYVWMRPFIGDRCKACGLCVKACPAGALRMEPGASRPALDAARCIECCCCHEVCPHNAIEMRERRFFRTRVRGRLPGGGQAGSGGCPVA